MKDFRGLTLSVGDIIYFCWGWGSSFRLAVVKKFTPKGITLYTKYGTESIWGYRESNLEERVLVMKERDLRLHEISDVKKIEQANGIKVLNNAG